MAQSSSPISGVAERYASSLFELAREEKSIAKVESDLNSFQSMLESSPDLQRLIKSPVFSAEEQEKAIGAIVGVVMKETRGRADGGEVTRLIREKLGL